MWTTSYIRRHIAKLKTNELFVSRDFLVYGTRYAIDNALSMMVKTQEIVRVARGVFMKTVYPLRLPSAFQVARVKALAFGKQIYEHGANAALEFGLNAKIHGQPTFATTGRTTSFAFGKTRIHLKALASRKVLVNKLLVGKMITALLYDNNRANTQTLNTVAHSLGENGENYFELTRLCLAGSRICATFTAAA